MAASPLPGRRLPWPGAGIAKDGRRQPNAEAASMEARSTMENAEDQRLLEQLQAASKSRGPHAKSIRSVIK
ncbi:MAG: hypothetical protein ACK53L_08160, partial [Pirellulaceae bacterium]